MYEKPPASVAATGMCTDVTSVGSIGPPYQCAKPCKFFMTRRGCKDAEACSHCHLCDRDGRQTDAPPEPPSIGSIGHPYRCAQACKFYSKTRGCMDGSQCERCHLCPWSRSTMRSKNG